MHGGVGVGRAVVKGRGTGLVEASYRGGWNRIGARVAAPLEVPACGSMEEFIVEHYWGYNHGRDGRTREYRVAHPAWQVAAADEVLWECDVPATYDAPFAEFLSVP